MDDWRLEVTMIGAQELKTILEQFTDRLASGVDSPYDVVIKVAMETTGAQACSLYLEEPSGDGQVKPEFIKMVSGAGFEQHRIGVKYRRNQGLTGTIWATSRSVKADTQAEVEDPGKGWDGGNNKLVREKVPGWKSYSLIGLPLRIGERTMGVLKVENKQPGPPSHFTEDDQLTLELIASTIALALEDHRRSEEYSGLTLNALREVSEMLVGRGTLTFTVLCDSIVEKCIEVFNAEACSLYLGGMGSVGALEPEYIIMLSGVGYEQNRKGKARYSKGQGLTGTIWQTGLPVKYDTQQELENPANGWKGLYNEQVRQNVKGWVCTSLIGVPLRIGDRIIGVLKVENKKPVGQTHFTFNDLRTLEILAANIALSLEMRRHYEDLFQRGERARAFAHDAPTLVKTAVDGTTDARTALRLAEGKAALDARGWLEDVSKALRTLTEHLESLKRVDRFRRRAPTSLNHLLESIDRRFKPLTAGKEIDFKVLLLEQDVFVNVNEDQFLQAFDNLVGNAIEALGNEPEPRRIRLEVLRTGGDGSADAGSIVILLTDNGPGFNPQQRHSFEDGHRLPSTKPSGGGMGLYIVDTIFRDNEIRLKMVDPPADMGTGAAFEIDMYTCVPRRLKVLVVDDIEAYTDRLSRQAAQLRDVELEVRNSAELLAQAGTKEGQEARQTLGSYDRILLDCRLGTGPDGPSLLKRIQEQDGALARRIVLMSSVPDYTDRHDVKVWDKFANISRRFPDFLQDLRQDLTDANSDR
jgi:signal transduction histidine kinase/CheY-like chemotaxis protein